MKIPPRPSKLARTKTQEAAMNRLLICAFAILVFTVGFDAAGQQAKKNKKSSRPPVVVQPDDPMHDPQNAVANLDVHPELQATLFASEPMITNPVNLDIDHRGRVWICDVKNYRGNNGKRPEGDRILILRS